jgi:hypothetical protein
MKTVTVTLKSVTPYSQSRQHDTPRKQGETWEDYEKRTWRDKCNIANGAADGEIIIPAMALKQLLDSSAKKLSIQIPGKGKATYTKHFISDVICDNDIPLGVKKSEVKSVTINANSDGVRGSGKRVKRTFPQIEKWEATTATFTIFDDTITRDIFEQTLTFGGKSIGIGRFRPEKGGLNGRFVCSNFRWSD